MRTNDTVPNMMISAYRLIEAKFKEPVKNEYQKGWNDALNAAVEQETNIIQHVEYTQEQLGYDK